MLAVVKVGSSVLAGNETRNLNQIYDLVGQMSRLWEMGHQAILVTSGAVATGRTNRCLQNIEADCREIAGNLGLDPKVLAKQAWAGAGQPELMADYIDCFRARGRECAQVLVTSDQLADFDSSYSRNILGNIQLWLRRGVIPIINENDVATPEELEPRKPDNQPGDNDRLAASIALLTRTEKLIILTDVDGVYDGPPQQAGSRLIQSITSPKNYYKVVDTKSGLGQGGMHSKLYVADWLMPSGITVHIANGHAKNVLERIMNGDKIGTVCKPSGSQIKLEV